MKFIVSIRDNKTYFYLFTEAGDFTLIGATTENPSYELNSALLSRARVLILQRLSR